MRARLLPGCQKPKVSQQAVARNGLIAARERPRYMSRTLKGFLFFEITHPHAISQAFGRMRKKLFPNKPNISFHSCRHTFATKYLEQGGQLYRLQTILGHASIETTRRIYGKDTKKALIENIDHLTDF